MAEPLDEEPSRHVFYWALGLSIVVHAMVLLSSGWKLGSAPPPPISVHFMPPPPVVQAQAKPAPSVPPVPKERHSAPRHPVSPEPTKQPSAPASKPTSKPVAPHSETVSQNPASPSVHHPSTSADAEEVGSSGTPASASSTPASASPSAAENPWSALQASSDEKAHWPTRGRIVYDVYYGDRGILAGRTLHDWTHDDAHYSMQTHVETVGLVSLLKSFQYDQSSEGGVSQGLLIPARFTAVQSGRPMEEARFDWGTRHVEIQRRDGKVRDAELSPGDQDLLSLWHQVALMGRMNERLALKVITNKAASDTVLSSQGTEALSLPLGMLLTEHVKVDAAGSGLTLDIWLARTHNMLPVRVRVQDAKGEVIDQWARELSYDQTRLVATGEWHYLERTGAPGTPNDEKIRP